MALFDVGSWESSSGTDSLNKKLFDQEQAKDNVQKHKQSVPDHKPSEIPSSQKKKKKKEPSKETSAQPSGKKDVGAKKHLKNQRKSPQADGESNSANKTNPRNKYRHLAKNPRQNQRDLMNAINAMVKDKSDEDDGGKLLVLKPNTVAESHSQENAGHQGKSVNESKASVKKKKKRKQAEDEVMNASPMKSPKLSEGSPKSLKKRKKGKGKLGGEERIGEDIGYAKAKENGVMDMSPMKSPNLSEGSANSLKKKKGKRKLGGEEEDLGSPKAKQIKGDGLQAEIKLGENVQKKRKKKKNNPKKNKFRQLPDQNSGGGEGKAANLSQFSNSNSPHGQDSSIVSEKNVQISSENVNDSSPLTGTGVQKSNKKKKKQKLLKDLTQIEDSSISISSLGGDVHSKQKPQVKLKEQRSKPKHNVGSSPGLQKSHGAQSPFSADKLKEIFGQKSAGHSGETNTPKIQTKDAGGESDGADEQKEESLLRAPLKKREKKNSMTLGERMREQLNQARFRYLNEKLYTTTGEEAFSMMQEDPQAFHVYHSGYSSQVEKWPLNPVNMMIDYIKKRSPGDIIADFGCGDAKLAQGVKNKVHSFDLVAVNQHVTACDMAHVPLSSGNVDIAVFCLSLMGTNMVDYICEASRVLRNGGRLLVAEVVSRFEKVGNFVRKMEKLGFSLLHKDESNKMFLWMEFKKTGEPDVAALPQLELAPCVYKKR